MKKRTLFSIFSMINECTRTVQKFICFFFLFLHSVRLHIHSKKAKQYKTAEEENKLYLKKKNLFQKQTQGIFGLTLWQSNKGKTENSKFNF